MKKWLNYLPTIFILSIVLSLVFYSSQGSTVQMNYTQFEKIVDEVDEIIKKEEKKLQSKKKITKVKKKKQEPKNMKEKKKEKEQNTKTENKSVKKSSKTTVKSKDTKKEKKEDIEIL